MASIGDGVDTTDWAVLALPTLPPKSKTRWSVRSFGSRLSLLHGSCACGWTQYNIETPCSNLPLLICYCHCALCRKLSGSDYLPYVNVAPEAVKWYTDLRIPEGRHVHITTEVNNKLDRFEMERPTDFADINGIITLWGSTTEAARGCCAKCGSTLFMKYHSTNGIDIAVGTLVNSGYQGRQVIRPGCHIMVSEKAPWEKISADGLPRFDNMPGREDEENTGQIQVTPMLPSYPETLLTSPAPQPQHPVIEPTSPTSLEEIRTTPTVHVQSMSSANHNDILFGLDEEWLSP